MNNADGIKPLRILYVTLQSLREGQAGYTHVTEIVKGLRKRCARVDLLAPRYSESGSPGLLARLWQMLRVQLEAAAKIIRSRFRGPNSCLYLRWHFAGVIVVPVAIVLSVPIVVEVNGPPDDLYQAWPNIGAAGKWLIAMERWILKRADRIIVVTPGLAEWVRNVTSHCQIDVVPNGADTTLFCPESDEHRPDRPYFMFFGALAPWQGISTMLAAVQEDEWPEGADLVIAGDGAERDLVTSFEDPRHRVRYLGKIPYHDIPPLVGKGIAGLSVKSYSASTGLSPLKVYETMACGVPVISSNQPYLSDLISGHGCGIVIPPDNPRALASAARYLFEHRDEALAMGQRGRAAAVSNYSWDTRAASTFRIISSLFPKNARADAC